MKNIKNKSTTSLTLVVNTKLSVLIPFEVLVSVDQLPYFKLLIMLIFYWVGIGDLLVWL